MNQQAFPSTNVYWNADGTIQKIESSTGMSLRDYFAAHATEEDIRTWSVATNDRQAARFKFADAMLAEREKE